MSKGSQNLCQIHKDIEAMEVKKIHEGIAGMAEISICRKCMKEREEASVNPKFIIPA